MKNRKRISGIFLIIWLMIAAMSVGCRREVVIETSENREEQVQEEPESTGKQAIYVHVCGAVRSPGVYELEEGSRVAQAVKAAGGFIEDASEESLNLARTLNDGEQILVLTEEEMQEQRVSTSAKPDGRININTAGVEELTSLSGIGEAKAEAILLYRDEHGSFLEIEDICNVSGIGESTFDKIKDRITVN